MLKFAVIEQEMPVIGAPAQSRTARAIVLRDEDHGNMIVPDSYRGLEHYAVPFRGHLTPRIQKTASKQHLLFVTSALNFWTQHGIESLAELTYNDIRDFFDSYRATPKKNNPESFVSQATLDKCVSAVLHFLANVCEDNPNMHIVAEDLLMYQPINEKQKARNISQWVPAIRFEAVPSDPRTLIRDIPIEALDLLLMLIRQYDPMIYFAVILMRYGGLRAGEAMNVRQENSPVSKTPGIKFLMRGDHIESISIDLSREFILRSDHISVGKIKRKVPVANIWPDFVGEVFTAYLDHLKILEHVRIEEDYLPMFVASNGKAMTVETFNYRFHQIVSKHFIPALLQNKDLEDFGLLLQESGFGSHIMRHVFTVDVAIACGDAATLSAARGDISAESCLAYLREKGRLATMLDERHRYALDIARTRNNFWSDLS